MELHEAIMLKSTLSAHANEDNAGSAGVLQSENERLQMLALQYQEAAAAKERQLSSLKQSLSQRDAELAALRTSAVSSSPANGSKVNLSKPAFFALILLLICLAAFAGYSLLSGKNNTVSTSSSGTDSTVVADSNEVGYEQNDQPDNNVDNTNIITDTSAAYTANNPDNTAAETDNSKAEDSQDDESAMDTITEEAAEDPAPTANRAKKYTLAVSRAYFYDRPDESSRRNNYLVFANNAELTAAEEKNGFIYVVFFNTRNEITKGWLRKQDLKQMN
jgi:eukaryotic-like serine/threonine-protein kinase